MSTQYNGKPDNIAAPGFIGINSSTNENPSVITSSAPHGLTSGDYVRIVDHATNTAINGEYPVTVLSGSTFSVPVAGNGAGGHTGAFISLGLGATAALPSDGDDENGASVDTPLENALDRTAALAKATGAYKLAEILVFPLSGILTDVQWTITTGAGNTWTLAGTGGAVATIGDVQVGDIVELAFDSQCMDINSTSIYYGASLATSGYAPGASPPAATRLPGSSKVANIVGGTPRLQVPLSLSGTKTVTVTGNLDVWLMGITGSASTLSIMKDSNLIAKVWRATGRP